MNQSYALFTKKYFKDDLETFLTENCYKEVDAYKIPEHETNQNPSCSGNYYNSKLKILCKFRNAEIYLKN